jgi:type I restriction enzyme S subunit
MATATKTIPSGYKQTEIGVIPSDWDTKEVLDFTSGVASGKSKTNSEFGDFPIYGSTGIIGHRARPDYSGEKILIARVGANAGAVNKVSGDYCVSDNTLMVTYRSDVDITFSYYQLLNFGLNKLIFGSGQPLVTGGQIKKVVFPIPKSKSEQIAIAIALSDADELIEKLTKLIEKKKNIKQGAMQELLTGKRRLPGFSGKWIRKNLGELGEVTGSGVDKKTRPEEVRVRLLNFLDVFHRSFIYSKDLNHEVTARPDQLVKCSVKKGDIFFTPSSEMPFDIGISAIAMEDMPGVVHSYHVDRFRLFADWDLLFRAYIFQTKDFSDQTATHCEGSGKRYVLSLTAFRERLTVFYPEDKEEQSAIARILFDMDAEIERLESQLSKYQNLKQGMMQTLLTGKIRLM